LKKIIKEIFFNNIGLTCNFAELIYEKVFSLQPDDYTIMLPDKEHHRDSRAIR